MWWSIIKSPRDEAYRLFLEAFGTNVELPEIKDWGAKAEPYMYSAGFGIGLDDVKSEIEFKIIEGPPRLHKEFILGMFESEYPDRYEEIKNKLLEVSGDRKGELRLGNKDVIYDSTHLPDFPSMSSSDRAQWLSEHDFCYAANGSFVAPKVRNYLIGSIISYYEGMGANEVTELFNRVSYNFGEFTSIGELFYEYAILMQDLLYNETTFTRDAINSNYGQFVILRDILEGRLQKNPYYKRHFGRQGGTLLAIRHKGDE